MDERFLRRSVGAPAARAALLTVLGEYVAPAGEAVYRDTLVTALEALGYRTDAARQAVARSVAAGWLTSSRVGRRALVRLTPQTRGMLQAGYPRIYHFGEPREWDGRWLLIVVRVPEERRDVRDRLRTKLAWAGFGSLGGGVWISPHVERESEVSEALNGAAGAGVLAFSGRQVETIGRSDAVVGEAWDLVQIADQYETFIRDFERVVATTPEEMFAAQTAMVHAWRRFPLVDPDLPEVLLPEGWPRRRALELFRERHDRWRDEAEAYFRALDRRT